MATMLVSDLAAAVAGVRGLLLDVDGVLVLKERALPGAVEAVRQLAGLGVPYRLATNTSLWSRPSLARQAVALGFPVVPEQIVSALSVSAAYTARRYPAQPLYVICSADARREFEGQHLLGHAEADAADTHAAAVIIGDAPEALTHAHLNAAFRLIRGGARLIAMHRNGWWLTPRGPTLDSGAFVAGLEYATGRRALVLGKPARGFYRQALHDLGLPRHEVLMVGDDLRADVAGAHGAGLRAVLALSGKTDAETARAALAGTGPGRPDAVAIDLGAIVAALETARSRSGPGAPAQAG